MVLTIMDKVDHEETRFVEVTQVFSSSAVTNEKKHLLNEEDLNTIFSLLDQLNGSQQLLTNFLVRYKVCLVLLQNVQFCSHFPHKVHVEIRFKMCSSLVISLIRFM